MRFSTKFKVLRKKWAYFYMLTCLLILFPLSSCFTGVESTKKINLSRVDRKNMVPTPEDLFMSEVAGTPLGEWPEGKQFIVSDNKALMLIVPQEGAMPFAPDSVKGEIFEFLATGSSVNAAGTLNATIKFTDGLYVYSYNTGRDIQRALQDVKSDQIPTLIDVDMVNKAREVLTGKKFFSRTNLWYDSLENRIEGKKYIEVTVEDVMPGNMIFPLKLKIRSEDNDSAFLFMNFGTTDNESRAFPALFSLTDIRKHYPNIEPSTWKLISRGKVKEGMTKEEVKLAMGNPTDLNSGHDYSQTLDIWSYENGKVLWFEDGRLVKIRQ